MGTNLKLFHWKYSLDRKLLNMNISIAVFIVLFACAAAQSKTRCGPWPQPCSKIPHQVCDNGGGTHANECHFMNYLCSALRDSSKITKSLPIQVPCPTKSSPPQKYVDAKCAIWDKYAELCGHRWKPVCDSDGVTSANICEFERRQCRVYYSEKRKIKLTKPRLC